MIIAMSMIMDEWNMAVEEWNMAVEGWNMDELNMEGLNLENIGSTFINNCSSGNWNDALLVINAVRDNSYIMTRAFIDASGSGQLDIVQRLREYPICYGGYPNALVEACANGHLEMATWLHTNAPIDMDPRSIESIWTEDPLSLASIDRWTYVHALHIANQRGHLDVKNWLLTTGMVRLSDIRVAQ